METDIYSNPDTLKEEEEEENETESPMCGEGTYDNEESTYPDSPVTETPEADPIEPDDVRVPILGYDVMESRSKFTHKRRRYYCLPSNEFKGQGIPVEPVEVKVPIVGYEIMERRERTIVYKIEVERNGYDRWFVFRRYNDFYQLNDKLQKLFPNFRLSLPPRRWFRSNYDTEFLEERQIGLQAFLNNITGHKDICNCKDVRDFFCFDDPPGPHDSLEESRALCENLEETIYLLRKEMDQKDEEIDILQEELTLYKSQVEILTTELRSKKQEILTISPVSNQLSLAECDQDGTTESDQSAASSSGESSQSPLKTAKEERKVTFPWMDELTVSLEAS